MVKYENKVKKTTYEKIIREVYFMAQHKLELTWYGKDKEIKVEPRLLIENPKLSFSSGEHKSEVQSGFSNMLIHGDNLIALKSLENFFANKIKCIYIDPPYNTGSAFEHYDDSLEHSTWLNLMKPRIEILKKLLTNDGVIFIQIDDNEMAYLTVMLDEIFGRINRINTIVVNMSNLSGVKINSAIRGKRFPKIKEYILVYVKNKDNYLLNIPKAKKDKWDSEYNLIIPELTKKDYELINNEGVSSIQNRISTFSLKTIREYAKENNISDSDDWKQQNSYRIVGSKPNTALLNIAKSLDFENSLAIIKSPQGLDKLIKTDFNRKTKTARIELVFAKDNQEVFFGDHWSDIVTTGGVGQEGGGGFPNGKKPEKLIHRIISTATNEGDYVLDSFLGSGTTVAVAHKMNRKWIGIEIGDHAYTHAKKRLDSIIKGEDNTGVTNVVGWPGGGGYKFYELAPSLINIDDFGQEVINPDYNADMLASAIALHEGYTYEPDKSLFWKQAKNGESSFLFTTTKHVDQTYLDTIHKQMKDDEFLIISCKSYESRILHLYKNISIKKIPHSLLKNCEFGVDNYNLNIISPPMYGEDEEDE